MMHEFDCWMTDEPVCPHCGNIMQDAWELFNYHNGCITEVDCEACDKPYRVTVDYTPTYSTEAVDTNDESVDPDDAMNRCLAEEVEFLGETLYQESHQSQMARLQQQNAQMLEVLKELRECAEYWSEYYVPIGIHERINNAIMKAEGMGV